MDATCRRRKLEARTVALARVGLLDKATRDKPALSRGKIYRYAIACKLVREMGIPATGIGRNVPASLLAGSFLPSV